MIIPGEFAVLWNYINKVTILHYSFQLISIWIWGEATSMFLIGVQNEI